MASAAAAATQSASNNSATSAIIPLSTQYFVTEADGKVSLRSSEPIFSNKVYIKQKIEEVNNEELTDISGLWILNEYLLYLKKVGKIQDNSGNYLGGMIILNFENWRNSNSNYGYVAMSMKKKQLEMLKKKGNFLFDMINKFPTYIHNFEIQEDGKIDIHNFEIPEDGKIIFVDGIYHPRLGPRGGDG